MAFKQEIHRVGNASRVAGRRVRRRILRRARTTFICVILLVSAFTAFALWNVIR